MEFRVVIDPNKEREFVKLLKVWQKLEVVKKFEGLQEHPSVDENWTKQKTFDTFEKISAKELVSQYRDLVD